MARGAREEFTDGVENVTSRQAKLAEAQGAQTENQQRAEQSKQEFSDRRIKRRIGKASTAQREYKSY